MQLARTLYHVLSRSWYVASGRRPWRFGYGAYRAHYIGGVLASGGFDPGSLSAGYGLRLDERCVEYPWMFSRLPADARVMLDAGSVLNHAFLLDQPALRGRKLFISTLAPEKGNFQSRGISYVFEDLRSSCFRDGHFDVVASLSTVEHIGLDNAMLYSGDAAHQENRPDTYLDAIREFARVLRPGGVLLLSVPFGRRANHGWFQVFDAPMVDAIVEAFAPSAHREWIFRYLASGWTASDRASAADARYFDIHARKGYDPDFAAASRAVVCLELTR